MRNSLMIHSLAVAVWASGAAAACDDTLWLQSITVYRQSRANTASLGVWDSVQVNPLDSASLRLAGPVGLAWYPDRPLANATFHYTKFASNCGSDSLAAVEYWRVIDTLGSTVGGAGVVGVSKGQTEMPVRRFSDQVLFSGGIVYPLAFQWTSDAFDIGRQTSQAPIESWSAWCLGIAYTKPVAPNLAKPVANQRVLAFALPKAAAPLLDGFFAKHLATLRASVDSIGQGVVDSTRLELVKYRSVYGFAKATGIATHPLPAPAFKVVGSGFDWTLWLPRAATVRVVGLDGRLVRVLPAGQPHWDSRDASGLRVPPGVWLLHAEGLGTVPVMVR